MPRIPRPAGLRAGVIIGVALALVGAAVGTATGAVTPFQQVIVVNPAGSPVPVSGTISVSNLPSSQSVEVSNFPATQAVSGTVDIGNFPAGPLATKRVTVELTPSGNGGVDSVPFAQMNVTSVIVADGDDDNYDIGVGGFRLVLDHEGNFSEHFPAAFPAAGLSATCRNVLDPCDLAVTLLGY